MFKIVLFGPPGAGKGTQSQKIIDKYNLTHISTGEVLRKEIAKKTAMGILAASYIDDGNYVPDDMAIDIIANELDKNDYTKGFIFDGFPRTTFQAEKFSQILENYGGDVDIMISLDVDEDILVERLMERAKESGRKDDRKEEIIRKRIEIYKQRTALVANYYKKINKLALINGQGEIEEVFERICQAIGNIKNKNS